MRNIILIIFFGFFSCVLSAQVNFRASLSKSSLGINERVRIDFIIDKDGDNFTPPEFSNFRIVAGPSQSIKNSWINGKRSYSKTYTYFLSPIEKGNFKIGQASVEVDGETYKTMALNVVVTSAVDKPLNPNDPSYVADKNIHLVAEVSKTNPYLNEPVSIVYKLYVSQDTGVNNWRELDAPRYADFWSKNINIKNLTVENGTYKGEPYRYVILRKTVLYPQKTGQLSIEPLVLDITVQTPSNRRDFFGQILNNTVNKTVSAGKLKINVKPLPDEGKPENFSGAVGKFDLLVTTSKKELLLSEAFQLNLEIKGNGNFNLFSFPSINLPQSLEVYEPERLEKLITNFKGIKGSIKDQYTIVPSSPGKYSIPKISFNYFDPKDSRYKVQTSTLNYINVKGAIINNVRKGNNIQDRPVNKLGLIEYGNLSFKKKTKFQKINQEIFFSSSWFWIILLTPFAILFIVLLIKIFLNKNKNDKNWIRANNAKKLRKKYLLDAKKNIENKTKFYEALDKALMNYLKSILLFDNTEYNAKKIRGSLLKKSVSLKTIDLLEDIFNNCQMARYTPFDYVDMDKDYRRAIELISLIDNEIQ
ncbi:MAG TPA: BatD family protein [Flavobacteriaceae bacterium]|nr:BatD family protein [Flavobacteriaceae bacterium]